MEKEMINLFVPKDVKLLEIPLLTLAFYGDSVHTLMVRTYLLNNGFATANNLHKMASNLCSATKQAELLDNILPKLDEEELELVRRARNTKTHKPPKSCSLEIYKKATALEVLFGSLAIQQKLERLQQLFEQGVK